jgi:hypothetical protein
MKDVVTIWALMMGTVCILCILGMLLTPDKQTHWGTKNCEIAEFSPDFTPQEKADCRKMRSKK